MTNGEVEVGVVKEMVAVMLFLLTGPRGRNKKTHSQDDNILSYRRLDPGSDPVIGNALVQYLCLMFSLFCSRGNTALRPRVAG